MTHPPPANPHAAPAWKPLDANQRRVLGVLIEKARTTPAAYPITVNAVVTGCNQKNNRDPLTALDDFDVEKALSELCALGAASEIDWLGRVVKFKHNAYEWLGVNRLEMAVMAELLLRGAQALGDLRGRAARLEPIADLAALKPVVDALIGRGLMVELTPAGRGQVVSHNLYLAHELAEQRARFAGHVPHGAGSGGEEPAAGQAPAAASHAPTLRDPVAPAVAASTLASLGDEVAELRAEVAALRAQVRDLEARLTEAPG
jgi:uncharacterized protein YceH (UPF0502 family)